MAFRPRDLADRMAGRRKLQDGYLRETFTLPRGEARTKARDFLTRFPKEAYMSGVESWRELPDGDIEFTMSSMDKSKAMDAALSQIERPFGKGSIMRLGKNDRSRRSRPSPPARSASTSRSASAACRAAA